jgi:putative PIG3 family NAD(P)H quinone oxidoreductase
MHAMTLPGFGGPEALTWTELPDPEPGPGEVLVDVVATAVNRADLMQRQGFYPPPAGESEVPGLECSGRVAALGEGVAGVAVGDEVCALLAGGGYGTKVVVPVGQLLPVPDGVSLAHAGALPEVACTVWSNVFQRAALQPGELLLVHGGTSGIGTMAIQLAVATGARVITTVGSAAKAERALALGAEQAVLYREDDFVEVVRAAGGADVVLDGIGAKYLARNVAALADDGRLVTIGMQGGTKGELDLAALLAKRGAVHATSLRGRPRPQKAAIVAATLAGVWPLIEAGHVRPVIDRELALTDAAEAHRVVEGSTHVGKVLLLT